MTYHVTLDGVPMISATNAAKIRIVDVIELQPDRTTNAQERLGMPGSFLTRDHLNSRQVRVQFVILTDDYAKRTAALSDVTAWAVNGSLLEISDRPGQQLHVVCTNTPLTMSKRKWTELCEMTFTAFSVPFWEDAFPVQAFASRVTEATLNICPTGNVKQAPLCCRVTPQGGTLTALCLAGNGAKMTFSGLAVPDGKTLCIEYAKGFLTAKWTTDDGSVVPCLRWRTGDEYIMLNAQQNNSVSFAADTSCDVTAFVRGWYW